LTIAKIINIWTPGWPCSKWLQNITDDLSSFDMALQEARRSSELIFLLATHSVSLKAAGHTQCYALTVMYAGVYTVSRKKRCHLSFCHN